MANELALLDQIIARLDQLPADKRAKLEDLAREAGKDLFWVPNPGPQTDAYYTPADICFYGGEAGGGKSDLLVGLALNEHSISRVFRRHFKDIDGAGGLAPRVSSILGGSQGYSKQTHVFNLPDVKPKWSQVPLKHRQLEFGAFTNAQEAEAYQGRAADYFGFDELALFQEMLFRYIIAWNRPGAGYMGRCRVMAAGNPPVTPEGLWIVEFFAAWLDPRHPRPAKVGELRWYTTIKGRDEEVGKDWRGRDKNGLEILPRSRTFIRARLSDNPDLAETGYASQLNALPEHLREAFAEGKFETALEDNAWQVIPTEWILRAQQRWGLRQNESREERGRMTALGVDVSGGGADDTVAVPLYTNFFDEPVIADRALDVKKPSVVAGFIFGELRDDAQVNIDCTGGWGAGAHEHMDSIIHERAVACIFSGTSTARDRDLLFTFANKRAEYYWLLREALDPDKGDDIALPPGRRVVAELAAARYRLRGRTEIILEEKADIKLRLGSSPDIADAIVLAYAEFGAGYQGGVAGGGSPAGPRVNLGNAGLKKGRRGR